MLDLTDKKKESLVIQGSILAIASLIVRLIGFFYRIPLVNLLTSEGIGYYSNSYDIYMFFLMISSYGFPAAMSKITASHIAEKKYKEAHKTYLAGLSLSLLIGICFASIMWFGADSLAAFIATPKSSYAIKALAPALFIFSMMSIIRGYFQGMNTMVPTAISQIIEQIFNAAFSLIMAYILVKKGLEYGAAGGTLGTGIGALAGFIFLIFVYYMFRKKLIKLRSKDKLKTTSKTVFSYWKIILLTSIPMIIGTAILNFTNLVDMIMIQKSLLFKGYNEAEITTMYGIYTMKHKILISLPVTIAAALATATIPSITTSVVKKDNNQVVNKINMAFRFTLLIVIPAAVGEFVLAEPIIRLLFGNKNLEVVVNLLKIGAVSIIFFGISTISIGILQGIGKLKVQSYTSLISLVIKILINIILLYIFDFNIYGAVVANVLFAIISATLNFKAIKYFIKIKIDIEKNMIVPLLSSVVMGLTCIGLYYILFGATKNNALSVIISIIVGIITYFIVILILKGISEEEIKMLPKGNLIVSKLKKFKLL